MVVADELLGCSIRSFIEAFTRYKDDQDKLCWSGVDLSVLLEVPRWISAGLVIVLSTT
jgi:hypothetical protein